MNSRSTLLARTRRGEIDPVDSENDNESIDFQNVHFFQRIRNQPADIGFALAE